MGGEDKGNVTLKRSSLNTFHSIPKKSQLWNIVARLTLNEDEELENGRKTLFSPVALHPRRLEAEWCKYLDDFQVTDHSLPLFLTQLSRPLIAHPAMNTTSTAVHPHNVIEAKILYHDRPMSNTNAPHTAQRSVKDTHRNNNKFPTFQADVCSLTARAHIVVIRHINIKHQFTFHRFKDAWTVRGLESWLLNAVWHEIGAGIEYLGWINRANINFLWIFLDQLLFELLRIRKWLEPNVNVDTRGRIT